MTSNNLVCDFCHRPKVVWRYPCRTFGLHKLKKVPNLMRVSGGDWAACEDCAKFIESDKLDELAFLIAGLEVAAFLAARGMELNSETERFHIIAYGEMRSMYRAFSKNRKGARVLV